MLAEKYQQIMASGSKENVRKSQKTAKTLAVSKGKVYRDISMLTTTAKFRKGRVSPIWMNQIHDFFFREDISRAVPGKTVSAAFKQHKAMYLLSMVVESKSYKLKIQPSLTSSQYSRNSIHQM